MARYEYMFDLVARSTAAKMEDLLVYFDRDGRGLGGEKLTPLQRLLQFQQIVESPTGWVDWLSNAYAEMETTVADIPPELRAKWRLGSERVKAITVAYGINYLASMRKLAEREEKKFAGIPPATGPSLPFPEEGVGVMDDGRSV